MSRQDRIGPFYRPYMKDYVFARLSPGWLELHAEAGLTETTEVPFRAADLVAFRETGRLAPADLGRNMLRVTGIDPNFPHVPAYLTFTGQLFGPELADQLAQAAQTALAAGRTDEAALCCRAALSLRQDQPEALQNLALICRERYLKAEAPAEIGAFKAEAIDLFEQLTKNWPNLPEPWYYLGYSYLNLGLYRKAELTWQEFLRRSDQPDTRAEIADRLTELEQPVQIEDGINQVLAGRYEKGLTGLEPFLDSQFENWWPLSYHLGIAYSRLGFIPEALERFLRVLRLNPRHAESMTELADLYRQLGDSANERKYSRKAALVRADALNEEND